MVLKCYFKLKNNLLPIYFNSFIPHKSQGSAMYPIRNPLNQLPPFRHEYARSTLRCELIKITNVVSTVMQFNGILDKVHTHSLHGYSLYKKMFD